MQFHSALKWDECGGQINQGNAEGRKIAPFPFQYNLKWGRWRREVRGDEKGVCSEESSVRNIFLERKRRRRRRKSLFVDPEGLF